MTLARRKGLPDPTTQEIGNAGLYFNRFVEAVGDNGAAARTLFDRLATWRLPSAYPSAFERWKSASLPGTVATFSLTLTSPLAQGLGNDGPAENGLSFHHTYGTPVITGASCKGLARRVLAQTLPEETLASLLGVGGAEDESQESLARFFDAWIAPTDAPVFARDTITVHHPDYYASRGEKGVATDFDDPNPIPFLVVAPGQSFLFRVAVDSETPEADGWRDHLRAALEWALKEEGIGGKTNAGYGRFR